MVIVFGSQLWSICITYDVNWLLVLFLPSPVALSVTAFGDIVCPGVSGWSQPGKELSALIIIP